MSNHIVIAEVMERLFVFTTYFAIVLFLFLFLFCLLFLFLNEY